jgi:hypothetical protein
MFKVGDRVDTNRGPGTIIVIDQEDETFGVRLDRYRDGNHELGWKSSRPRTEMGHGWWFMEGELKKLVYVLLECSDNPWRKEKIHGVYQTRELADKSRTVILKESNKKRDYAGYLAVLEFKVK